MSYKKEYYETHKKECIAATKAWREANKDKASYKEYQNNYQKQYRKYDVNSYGASKDSIRKKSNYYLKKYGKKLPGYEIHHCCTYDEPYKFIYCNKEMHQLIHSYLRQHNIDANSDHYKYIKHLLDDTVILYGI